MVGFSAREALGSGFRLIRREPKALLVWTVLMLVLAVAPWWGALGSPIGLVAFYQDTIRSAVEHTTPDTARAMAFQRQMLGAQPLLILLMLVYYPVMLGAIYRAVLEPENRRWAYLRLGRQELWLLLAILAFILTMFIAMLLLVIIMIVVGIAVGAAAHLGSHSFLSAAWLVVLVPYAVMLFIMTRLCLGFPLTFDQKRFALFKGWRMSRSHWGKMFLTWLALLVAMILVELVFAGVVLGLVMTQAHDGWRALLDEPPEQLTHRLMPLWFLSLAVFAVIGTALWVATLTPLADIYRQLRDSAAREPAA